MPRGCLVATEEPMSAFLGYAVDILDRLRQDTIPSWPAVFTSVYNLDSCLTFISGNHINSHSVVSSASIAFPTLIQKVITKS